MKVTVTVQGVTVTVEGLDYTRRQVRALLGSVYATACLMDAPEAEERTPLGFAVITERAGDPEPEHLFTDDEEWGS